MFEDDELEEIENGLAEETDDELDEILGRATPILEKYFERRGYSFALVVTCYNPIARSNHSGSVVGGDHDAVATALRRCARQLED